ncbi:MAG TPA: hypothetical protein PK772_02850 [Chitinophagaceae bacterium]|nr:hypothetical protein [Chitinophagaceae bacterium]
MHLNQYKLISQKSLMIFEFTSTGHKGQVNKIIQYTPTELKNIYNLGFGDKDMKTGLINDLSVTDNGDSQKVLATVAFSIYLFTEAHPDALVYAVGSTKARTRLYRIGITNQWEAIEKDFNVYGLIDGNWKKFKKAITYKAFLVQRKKL